MTQKLFSHALVDACCQPNGCGNDSSNNGSISSKKEGKIMAAAAAAAGTRGTGRPDTTRVHKGTTTAVCVVRRRTAGRLDVPTRPRGRGRRGTTTAPPMKW